MRTQSVRVVGLLERIRRFWRPGRDPDHPLSEQEREGVPPTAFDEVASLAERYVGETFDADERGPDSPV
jgi:hypothetical protein